MHNHPSGDPSPSQADRQLTKRIVEFADVLGIRMLDHVIAGTGVGDSEPYFSFREMGLLYSADRIGHHSGTFADSPVADGVA
jgi:DNA repair protein RadC